jgi:hypothetical protein
MGKCKNREFSTQMRQMIEVNTNHIFYIGRIYRHRKFLFIPYRQKVYECVHRQATDCWANMYNQLKKLENAQRG